VVAGVLTLVLSGCGGTVESAADAKSPGAPDLSAGGDSTQQDLPKDNPQKSKACTGAFVIEQLDGMPAEQPPGGFDYVFEQETLRTFELEIDPDDWEWLQANALEEQYVPAMVVYDGLRYGPVGARFKGAWSTLYGCFDEDGNQTCTKLSMKLRFNKYDPCGRFFGLRRLVFNANAHDESQLRERLMYNLMRNIGMTASRASSAVLKVNGGPDGVYTLVEPIGKEYLVERFPDPEGNLYKQVWPVFDYPEPYLEALRTNEETDDVERMLQFAQTLENSTPTTFEDDIQPFVDLEIIARMMAFARAIGDDDGVLRYWCDNMFDPCQNHNYYWYDEPGGKIHLLPWDQDITFLGYREKDELSIAWWEQPLQCTPIPLYVFEGIDDPSPSDYDLVLPPQCDTLLHEAVMNRQDDYLDALYQIQIGLGQSVVDLESYRSQLAGPLAADKLLAPSLDDWEIEVDWLKKKMNQQIAVLEEYLNEEQ